MAQDRSGSPELGRLKNTLISAENGDVVRYDETGLILRLSDRVLEDIAERLGGIGQNAGSIQTISNSDKSDDGEYIELPETLDAWSVRQDGEWLKFTANPPGKSGPRGFMSKGPQGTVIADTPTPLLGILAIGGSRASVANTTECDFPFHIVAPGDDIGGVGLDGVERAKELSSVHMLREMSHEALVAQVLLNDALVSRHALPLYYVRGETDGSTSASALAVGMALENLSIAAKNMKAAAADMGKRGEILGVFIDFSLEDVVSAPAEYRDGMIALMENISRNFARDGVPAPRFFSFFECVNPSKCFKQKTTFQREQLVSVTPLQKHTHHLPLRFCCE